MQKDRKSEQRKDRERIRNFRLMDDDFMFKNARGVLAAAWSNAKHSSADYACDPPESLSQSGIESHH